jgi:hypothetical protein
MPSSEIVYWHDFFSIYPFTQDREDIRTALICYITQASQGGKLKMEDFIPNYLKDGADKIVSLKDRYMQRLKR